MTAARPPLCDLPPLAWAAPARIEPLAWADSLCARAVLAAALLGVVCACGSGGGASAAKSAEDADDSSESSTNSGGDSDAEVTAADAPDESAAPRDRCEDGGCFACGDGVCLDGWYCDESAKGGPACSWIPECATKAGCGCVTRALGSDCSCKEESGAAHVTCR